MLPARRGAGAFFIQSSVKYTLNKSMRRKHWLLEPPDFGWSSCLSILRLHQPVDSISATLGPLAALHVDPDPELQVRHRRTRGRAMVCEKRCAWVKGTMALLSRARCTLRSNVLLRVLYIDQNQVRQTCAEPTKMQRPLKVGCSDNPLPR